MKMAITFLHELERDGIVKSNHFFYTFYIFFKRIKTKWCESKIKWKLKLK